MKKKLNTEYEATFFPIDKDEIRQRLVKAGATLIHPEFLQKRVVFKLPKGHEIEGGWMRVRQEYDKITMSLKIINGKKIKDQKEVCLKIDDFDQAIIFLTKVGCRKKAYQENKREKWILGETEITIEEWPFLEPYIEVEGKSETEVKKISEKLGFDYEKALFCSVDFLYCQKYKVTPDQVCNHTPLILFGKRNPYSKQAPS